MSNYHSSICFNCNSYEKYRTLLISPLSHSRHLAQLFCPLGSSYYSSFFVQSTEVPNLAIFSHLYFYQISKVCNSSFPPLSLKPTVMQEPAVQVSRTDVLDQYLISVGIDPFFVWQQLKIVIGAWCCKSPFRNSFHLGLIFLINL